MSRFFGRRSRILEEEAAAKEVSSEEEIRTQEDAAEALKESGNTVSFEDTGAEDEVDRGGDLKEADKDKKPEKMGFFKRLKAGLSKTRNNIVSGFDRVFGGYSTLDDDFYEELEEILIMGDIGVEGTEKIIEDLKTKVKEQRIKEPAACRELLMDSIKENLQVSEGDFSFENETSVILVVGVNGVGKTTTVGKLAAKYKNQGKKVLVVAADTFRAAATEQLEQWAKRAGVDIVSAGEGADPGSVVYDGMQAAKARGVDVVLCDTAGRLHNKKNLMQELGKINRIVASEFSGARRETFVVLDGTTGQNALSQAREFSQVCDLTGIIITKLDGTSKGGIAIAISAELGIPIKYIGVGESIEDLERFDSGQFVEALFDVDKDEQILDV